MLILSKLCILFYCLVILIVAVVSLSLLPNSSSFLTSLSKVLSPEISLASIMILESIDEIGCFYFTNSKAFFSENLPSMWRYREVSKGDKRVPVLQ